MKLAFAKYHGRGNDFVLVDGRSNALPDPFAPVAVFLADRHFGIGCDQVLVAEHGGADADVRMRVYNADGSLAEMCGNGIRAFAKFIWAQTGGGDRPLRVQTDAGLRTVERRPDGWLRVAMGEPAFTLGAIGADPTAFGARIGDEAVALWRPDWPACARDGLGVSIGNPHVVFFVSDLSAIDLDRAGPRIERDPAFTGRINVEFVQMLDRHTVRARIWERGAGATLACGTGATALAVAAIRSNHVSSPVRVSLPGGVVEVEWSAGGPAWLSGPAQFVAAGEVDLDAMAAWKEREGV